MLANGAIPQSVVGRLPGNDAYLTSLDENHNHYTDGEKYLAEHYGDRLADQKNYESEEGWN